MQDGGQLRLFGSPRWQAPARSVELPDALPGYLLGYLALRGDWVAREVLAGLLWPDRLEAAALHNLRANLYRMRRWLADAGVHDGFDADPRRVRIRLRTDVAEFKHELTRDNWSGAANVQAAPLLAAFTFRGFALLDEWAQVERAALSSAWRGAALRAALRHEADGDAQGACALLLRLLRSPEPTEDAVQALLRVAAQAGEVDAALAEYERLLRLLREDLNLAPMQTTLDLAAALRRAARPGAPASAPAAGPSAPRALMRPPVLVGREDEIRLLADGAVPIVVVLGEPGIGKTRLLEDALPHAWWVSCREGLEQVPLAPIAELLEDQLESLPALSREQRRDLARLVPALLADEVLPTADATLAKTRLLSAIELLLRARGVPVVFDDLQWADVLTRELVVWLARSGTLPLRLAWRSTEAHTERQALLDALEARAPLAQITLQPLSAESLTRLLALLSGSADAPSLFAGWLHRRTGGNPFFALQILRALFDSGQLIGAADGWSSALDDITDDYSELQVPARVADIIRRRVGGLSEGARRVLAVLAVCGDSRAVDRVGAAAGLSAWAAAEGVDELQAGGLLREHRFVHDIVRQSVYRSTAPALRGVLHASVARLFEGVLRDEAIAEHWWLAGDTAQALAATARAVAFQRVAGLHDAALGLIEAALTRVDASGPRAQLHALRAGVRLEMGDFDGAWAEASNTLNEAAAPPDRAAALLVMSSVQLKQGRLDEAGRALADAAACDADHDGLCLARARLAQMQGRVADAVGELERRCAQLRRRPPGSELIQALTSLGAAYDELGAVDRGITLHREAYRLAARLKARYAQVEVAINLMWALSALQRDDEAVAIAEEALALGEYDSTPTLRNNLAWALRELGRYDESMRLCEQLAGGADPTLALIGRARLLDMRAGTTTDGFDPHPGIDALLDAIGSTDAYQAHVTVAKVVLLRGSPAQVERVLPHLRPQALDPWLHRDLSDAMGRRGIDPLPYLGPAPQATPPD